MDASDVASKTAKLAVQLLPDKIAEALEPKILMIASEVLHGSGNQQPDGDGTLCEVQAELISRVAAERIAANLGQLIAQVLVHGDLRSLLAPTDRLLIP